MGKTSYQSLDQLTEQISKSVSNLTEGNISNSELEQLTQDSQSLYERLIVIRHKAYELFDEPETPKIVEVAIEKKEEPVFDFTQSEPEKEVDVEDSMSFDFSDTTNDEPVVENVKEKIAKVDSDTQETNQSISQSAERSSSLNDTFKSSNSLADKLKQSKIVNLKSSIDINKKFGFISGLFGGSNDKYNEAIDKLNACSNGDDARTLLGEISQNNNWDVENDVVVSFVELVERRYI